MSACAQPGCSGELEDGYCNICGLAGPAASRGSTHTGTGSTRTGSAQTPLPRSTRSTRTASSRSSRAGSPRALANRPPLPALDPLAALVPGVVPEHKRHCSGCDAPLKRDDGFCPRCGHPYSFIPALSPGDLVAGKYEIKGTLAFGGLGWIYLARDTVLNRWVTLKGLLSAGDPRMLEVALAEREHLAAVKHPNIVSIHDFVTHGDRGYIVMEHVNGKTLMALRKERGGPLPAAEALRYIAEILPAFGYLDELGLVYCDFKPENAMVEEETVKLIDLGAVRRADHAGGDVYGSRGYAAPEAAHGPTHVSDLYTVGRALAVLIANFDFQGKYEHALPPPAEVPIFAEHEPLHRFLLKATRPRPEDRFQSAAEMAAQLAGVLHVVLGEGGPIASALFAPGDDRSSDPVADDRFDGFPRLRTAPEVAASPASFRLSWHRGRALLAQGQFQEALATFESLASDLPGELAPQLALGIAHEQTGQLDRAIRYHDAVSRADSTFTSATFRLARCLEKKGDRAGAVAAYHRVPSTSHRYGHAQMAIARLLIVPKEGKSFSAIDDLAAASAAILSLDGLLDGLEVQLLKADLLAAAALCVAETDGLPRNTKILGVDLDEVALRLAAEEAFRIAARQARTEEQRWALVDRANEVRPLTWT
ncbi:MAG: tetratricopeptide repeat protein [Minicystis sp.]